MSQCTRILNAASFLIDDEHPQALTEYLPDHHGSVSVDILKKVVLAFKGLSKQWRSSSFAEQYGVLHSKYELANLLIPSYSCHKQVLHEYRPETIHVFTILNEIFIHLSSWSFL